MTALAEPATFGAAGGSGTLTVTANRDCQWNAAASGNWIQLGTQSSGQGNATVAFSVTANPDPAQRRGAITLADHQVAISQEGAVCTFTVFPLNETVSPQGERRTIHVTAPGAQCSWSARTETPWLTILEGSQGSGSGQVVYEAQRTTGSSRGGELTVAGQRVIVTQATGCTFTVFPLNETVSPQGERRTIHVTVPGAQCSWSARTETPWLAILEGSQGSGSGQVVYEAQGTTGPSRGGELTVAGQRVIVTQTTGCSVTIGQTSQTVEASGGSGTINVFTPAGCPWSAQSDAEWISITSARSGTGPATVTFSVGPWEGPRRTGTLRFGTQVFTVAQNSGCRFTISPETSSVTSAGGSGAVAVTTTMAGCEWTAASNAPWITISNAGGTHSGNGTVQFAVAATTGPARSGTLIIAGRTFTVSQGSGCSYSISPAAQTVPSFGGPVSVAVHTSPGCPWTAASGVPWVRVSSGQSGEGPGAATFTVDGTPTSLPRSTTVSVAGQASVINQEGALCLVVLSPPSVVVGPGGGSGAFEVNIPEGCTWMAGSNDAWLRVTGGSSGSGDGTVSFSVDPNPGLARTGTIGVGSRLLIVSQVGSF